MSPNHCTTVSCVRTLTECVPFGLPLVSGTWRELYGGLSDSEHPRHGGVALAAPPIGTVIQITACGSEVGIHRCWHGSF